MLVRCLYASRSTQPLTEAVLDEILRQSRANNQARGITGMLAHADNIFVQVIEGGRAQVSRLLGSLYRDARHQDLEVLAFDEIVERRFGHWSMGRVKAGTINPALLLKYSNRAELDPFTSCGPGTLALMLEIAASGAIANRSM